MSSPEVAFAKRQYCDPSIETCPTSTSTPLPSLSLPTASSNVSTATSQTSTTQSPSPVASSSTSNAGTIAGCVVGGVAFLVLVVLGILLYLRTRKRRRTPPSSEFMNSLKAGTIPVLRLDSGAEYAPALAEKGGVYTHYSPADPLPFTQKLHYTSPTMQSSDEMVAMTDTPPARPSLEKSFHPQRFSSQRQASDSFIAQHCPSASVGNGRELWGSETDVLSGELSPMHQSPPRAESVLLFAPRVSLDEPPSHPSYSSQSPASLHHLRRQS